MFAVAVGTEELPPGQRGAQCPAALPHGKVAAVFYSSSKSCASEGYYVPGVGSTRALRAAHEQERRKNLVKWACTVSYVSIFMSVVFGVASMACGVMGDIILSLVALALETWIDMLSSVAVLWRFQDDEEPGPGVPAVLHPPVPFGRGCSSPVSFMKREESSVSTAVLPSTKSGAQKPKPSGVSSPARPPCSSKVSPSSPVAAALTPPCSSRSCTPPASGSPLPLCGRPERDSKDTHTRLELQAPLSLPGPSTDVEARGSSAATTPPSDSVATAARFWFSGDASPQGASTPTAESAGRPKSAPTPRADSLPPLSRGLSYAARERRSSMAVGCLFVGLAIWVSVQALFDLVATRAPRGHAVPQAEQAHQFSQELSTEYRSALLTCVLCWPSALIFGALALAKFDLAARLRSQVLGRDAMCSAFGVALSLVAGIVNFIALARIGYSSGSPHREPAAAVSTRDLTSYDAVAALVIGVLMLLEGVRTIATNWSPTRLESLTGNHVRVVASTSAYSEACSLSPLPADPRKG
ncbi:hypothetical protein BESB_074660 [Besnoitia besnoiti]|uniref:Transmembrane protein 163 n=1 Tax=Besnoitia besnoiti TaxID=94643 RepID=A0A2A9MAT2_BESBE|nr:uncharacterized protein BESB_074660 [Besnoitia besnoiti]PFH34314.1 hypothetical protein BESB_074660 [Besnoitia besnoiti]